jgi:hypothetical protein
MMEVTVTNLQGQVVSAYHIKSSSAGQMNSIDVGALQQGIYLLKVNTNNGSYARKFVKE